jgi:hypothetical protein
MPSTYSPDLRIELIANGEQSGTWGTTTNNNLGTIIEDAISGTASVVTAVQKYALLAANGAVDEARCAILVLDTTYVGAGNYEVYAPPVTKLYVVKNASSTKDLDLYCATTINGTTAAGTVYTIPQGKTAFVRSNGLTFFDATDYVAGSVTFTNANLITPSLSGETFSTANTVAAGSNSQGSGALTADYNIITTAANNPSGVTLPTATQGRRIIIVNKGANPVNVYPATGGAIDALSTNASTQIPVDGVLEFNASSTTRWYSYSALTLTSPLITTPSLVAAKVSTSASVTAGSNSQGSGALTADYNVITSAVNNPSGVTLPTATVGRKVLVVNKGANAVNVYPATNAYIDAIAINTAISLPVGGLLEFNASSTTQWYSSYNATTAASVGGVSFTGTQPTASVNQVAVYGATGSSITTARTYQFRATTGGQAQIQLFENATGGATDSIIIQPPNALAASYTLTLPADDGTNGQVLTTNGTGTLSWTTAAGGGVTSLAATSPLSVDTSTGAVTVSVANAGSSASGVVTTAAQTFGGTKRFATGLSVNAASVSGWGAYILSDTADPGLAVFNRGNDALGGYAAAFIYNPPRGSNPIIFQTGSAVTSLTTSGSVSGTNTTVAYNTSSDYRLKENVVPLTDAITKLKLLAPKRFTWKAAPEEGVVEGFIAHEVQEIVPTAVHGEKDAVDANGKIVPQGIDSSFLIPLLTAALQEAVTRIEALEAQLANQ